MSHYASRTHRSRRIAPVMTSALLIVVLGAGTISAQAEKPGQAAPPAEKQGATAAKPGAPSNAPAAGAVPPSASAYTYRAEGRRDPFVSLLGRGNDSKSEGNRPTGVAGLLINEVGVKGIVRDRSGFIAMVQGADNRAYVVRAGDRLMDGTVKAVVQDAVVFSQDVNDPLSLVKQKEVRKTLRATGGGRG
jgi:hypothetical protein